MADRDYIIEVKTANKWLAGTDDDVFIKIDGDMGTTGKIKLDNVMKNDFEKGKLDQFKYTFKNLGEITGVELSKIGSDDWKCDYVRIIDVTGKRDFRFDYKGMEINKKQILYCLSPVETAPVSTTSVPTAPEKTASEKTAPVSTSPVKTKPDKGAAQENVKSPTQAAKTDPKSKDYTIEIKTTNKFLAGTDDDVFFKMNGTNEKDGLTDWIGDSRWINLDNKMKNDFEKGNTDRFTITYKNLGDITNVELRKNGNDDWQCDYVRVIDVTGKRDFWFDFGGAKITMNSTKGKPTKGKPTTGKPTKVSNPK